MNEDKILKMLSEIDAHLNIILEAQKNVFTRDEFESRMNEMFAVLERLDKKRIFTK